MSWFVETFIDPVVNVVVDVVEFVVDDVIAPAVETVGDVIEYAFENPVKTAAQIYAIVTPGMQWLLPVIEGVDVAAKGGDIEDVAKAVAISIVAQEVGARVGKAVSTSTTNAATAAQYGTDYASQQTAALAAQEAGMQTAAQIAGNVAGSVAASGSVAVVKGQDPVKAMAAGGINAAVPAVLGQVDGFQNLTPTTQKIIETAVKTQLSGGDVSAAVVRAALVSSQIATNTIKKLDPENKLTQGQQAILADVVTASSVAAFTKGNVSEAVQAEIFNAGAKALGDMAKGKFSELTETVKKSSDQISVVSKEIQENESKQNEIVKDYNIIGDQLTVRIEKQNELKQLMDASVAKANQYVKDYNAQTFTDRATVDRYINEANTSVENYNTYVKSLNYDYENYFKPTLDNYEKELDGFKLSHDELVSNFGKEQENLKNLASQLGQEVESLQRGVEKAYVNVMDANFNPDEYRKINNLDESVDPYNHWLSTGQYENLPTNNKAAESAVYFEQGRLLTEALAAKDLNLTNLTKDDRERFYKTIEDQFGSNYLAIKNANIADFDVDDIFRTSSSLTTNQDFAEEAYSDRNRPSASAYSAPDGYKLASEDDIFNNRAVLTATGNGMFAWITEDPTEKSGYFWDPERGDHVLRIPIYGVGDRLKVETHGVGNTLSELRDSDPLGWFEMYSDYLPEDKQKAGLGDTVYDFFKGTYESLKGSLDPSTKEAIAKFAAAAKPESTTLDAMAGILGGFKGITDAFGADNRVSKALGDARGYIQSLYSAQALNDKTLQAKILDEAKDKGVLDQVIAGVEALAAYPGVIVEAAGTVAPNLVAAMATSVLGAPVVAARLAQYGVGAVSGAGIIKGTIYEETKKALIAAGVDPGTAEAKAQQAQAYNGKNLDSIVAGALLGTAAGGTGFEKTFVKEISSNIAEAVTAKNLAGQFVMGGLKEGIPEAAQGGQEKLAENIALQREGFEVPTWRGVAAAGTLEGVAGAPLGSISDVSSKLNQYDLAYTTPKELEERAALEGYQLKPEDYSRFTGAVDEQPTLQQFSSYVDPLATTESEARQFLAQQGYVNPTTADVQKIVGQLLESQARQQAVSIADPNVFDISEIKRIAGYEGYNISDAEAASLARQANEAEAEAALIKQLDPLAVTQLEATYFFNQFGYFPTDQELKAFVASKPENLIVKEIGDYVDPRQLSRQELNALADALGYKLSTQDLLNYISQGQSPTFETEQTGRFIRYADPLATTEMEAREFLANQGYKNPTQADVNKIVGQILESKAQQESIGIADPNVFDIEEAKAVAASEGYTLTDEQAKAVAKEANEAEATAAYRASIDPLAVTQAEAQEFFSRYGYVPNADQLREFTQSRPEQQILSDLEKYVNQRQMTLAELQALASAQGYQLSEQDIKNYVGQGLLPTFEAEQIEKFNKYADPLATLESEARQFLADQGYKNPTQEDVNKIVGQILESKAQQESIGIADPNVFDIGEVKAIAAAENFNLTDEQAAALAREVNEQEATATYRAEIDPLAVTEAEAREFFATYGYNPSPEELANFAVSKPEAEISPTIQPYVDPRQVTEAEARQFFEEFGYKPSAQELAEYTRQGKDIQQQQVRSQVESYVDPRLVTTPEVIQTYRSLGLDQPTQEDVISFVGQRPEEETLEQVRQNIDKARYNALQRSISQQQIQSKAKAVQDTNMAALLGQAAPAVAAADDAAKFKKPFITSTSKQEEFKGPLQEFMEEVKQSDYTEQPFTQSQETAQIQENTQQGEPMPNYFTYGQQTDLDQLFSPFGTAGTSFFGLEPMIAKAGGLATPLMARGGYAGGGLPMVPHSGKMRVDYRRGDAVTGPGDGQSDDIPAMLADGEFVIPADVVAALGNGSTKAGSDKLYEMMHSIRSHHRSARPKDLPPPAKKSPLDYLKGTKKSAKAARR